MSPHLVGGFNHLEKYEFVNGKHFIPIYEMENNPAMFQSPPTSIDMVIIKLEPTQYSQKCSRRDFASSYPFLCHF
jgi:hypothetical protein